MHMQQSAKALLLSLPIKVIFAGWEGNTLSLARAGWDLNIEQSMGRYGDYQMNLAMRLGNKDNALYAVSHPCRTEYGRLAHAREDRIAFQELLAHTVFEIAHVANDILYRTIAQRDYTPMSARFMPIDAMPQEREITESIRDFKWFKTANPDVKDLIVSPEQVPELLDLILRTQKPQQKEIRAREKSRENLRSYRSGEMFDAKPAHQVQAQLITLAG